MVRGRIIVLLVVGAICGAAACTSAQPSAPFGKGDHLIVDVDASDLPAQPDAYVAPDSTFAQVEGSTMYGAAYDAAAQLIICDPSDGSASADDAGAAPSADGAAAVASSPEGGAAGGCVPFPAACASEPNCQCLFPIFGPQLPCPYPHCSVGQGFSFYCPP